MNMFFRYLGISIVKWIAVFSAIMIFTSYIAPQSLRGYWLALPIWILVCLIAYGFGYWAFHLTFPNRRDVIMLLIIWMVVTICLEAFYEIMTIGQPVFLLRSPDLYVQYLLEIVGVLLAIKRIRTQKMRAASGEGLAT